MLDNIRKFLHYLLSSNMGEVLTVLLGVGSGVIGLNATDAANAGSTGGAVVLPLLATQLQTGVVIALVSLLIMDYCLPGGLIADTGDLTTARTAGFTVLVFTSLFTSFTARSDTTSAFAHLFANPWLWSAVALSLLLQVAVVHVPFLNIAFGTAPLARQQWLVCAAMASGVLIYSEGQKRIRRRWGR